jgi:RNA recognition motif-containing protein
MLKIYAGNLPSDMTEKELTEMFSAHGRVRSVTEPVRAASATGSWFGA